MASGYELYLIRHGLAEARGEAWPDDAKRPLSERGTGRVRKSARGLSAIGVSFDVILTSPFVRARQTADVLASSLDPRPPIVQSDALAPGGSHQTLVAELEKLGRRTRIALIGHEPGIGELAAKFAGLRAPLEFKKGAICRIDVDSLPPDGPGRLRWFLTPKILRALKNS